MTAFASLLNDSNEKELSSILILLIVLKTNIGKYLHNIKTSQHFMVNQNNVLVDVDCATFA